MTEKKTIADLREEYALAEEELRFAVATARLANAHLEADLREAQVALELEDEIRGRNEKGRAWARAMDERDEVTAGMVAAVKESHLESARSNRALRRIESEVIG